jgi:hypothetical protein
MRGYSPRILIGIALPAALAGAVLVWAWKSRQLPAQGSAAPGAPAAPRASAGPAIPEALRPLSDTARPSEVRVDLLRRALKSRCGEDELVYLYHLLERGAPRGEAPEHWYVVANDIMEQLRLRDPDESRYCARLLALLGDARQPPVLRDYAVQHLALWLDPRRPTPAGPAGPAGGIAALRGSVITSLAQTAADPSIATTSIPGTVLMVLVNLSHVDAPACAPAFASLRPWLAGALADGSKLSPSAGVSAIHAAAAAAPADYLPAFRAVAYHRDGVPAMRLAAIAAIARCGDATDLDPLRLIPAATPALAFAANDAIRVLSTRLNLPTS